MVGRRQYIHELPAKLEFLVGLLTHGSWDVLERRTGIGRATLSNCRNRNHKAYSRLGTTHQELLAKKFNFGLDWPEWRGTTYVDGSNSPRTDTAEAFAQKYGPKLRVAKGDAAGSVEGASSQLQGPDNSARSVDGEVKAGAPRPASSPMGTMAQVTLELGQPAGPGAHQVLVEVSCHATNIVGSNRRFSVRRALLSIDCGHARGRREAIAGIAGGPVQLSNAQGDTTFDWCGSAKLLRWEVTASGTRIGYLWFDAGVIEELAHGDVLRVSLSAWLKHIDVVGDEGEPTFGILDANDRLLDQPEETVTIEQQRLIEHLNKLRLPVDANGYAEIAAHEFEVVRKS